MLLTPQLVLTLTLLSDIDCIRVQHVPDYSDSVVIHGGYGVIDDVAPQQSQHHFLRPVPLEYFQYPAKKPHYAINIATYHQVPNPQSHYRAYPIRTYNGLEKPRLGRHEILNPSKTNFQPFQKYTQENAGFNVSPVSSNYEIFHPYKAEEENLKSYYKDPVLSKIKSSLRDTDQRHQKYVDEAGKPDIKDEENLEKFEETDRKKVPQKNILAPYEVYTPQKRPAYYQAPAIPPVFKTRENILNNKFKHPLYQDYAKIKPKHYQPIKNYIAKLKQIQGLKYDDTRNQYPQLPLPYTEPEDGLEIFEKGKANFVKLRNNIDESVSQVKQENSPATNHNLELLNDYDEKILNKNHNKEESEYEQMLNEQSREENDREDEEFVPVKNYAQVRKTETMKIVPKLSAYNDAESYDEMLNAPRLREAIKSTKAQTVYTEEGYEDAAYDHAGEQKHADENEGHAGYLREKEKSGGKYRIPTVDSDHQDAQGEYFGDGQLHKKEWKGDKEADEAESDEEEEEEEEAEDEVGDSLESDIYEDINRSVERSKREKINHQISVNTTDTEQIGQSTVPSISSEIIQELNYQNNTNSTAEKDKKHGVIKRETIFKIPQINITSTFLTDEELEELKKIKHQPKQVDIKDKYPYYFQNLRNLNRDSPLRYAENMKFIPSKSNGGSEFYDSRSILECPEVGEDELPIPEKLSEDNNPNADFGTDEDQNGSKHIKKEHRLKGLGDKIDCFKAKFFGKNPLDSPFFKEDLISNPEPVTMPNKPAYKLIKRNEPSISESKLNDAYSNFDNLQKDSKFEVSGLFDELKNSQKNLQESLIKTNEQLRLSLNNVSPLNISKIELKNWPQQANIYTDVLGNIKNNKHNSSNEQSNGQALKISSDASEPTNVTYDFYHNKEDVTKPSIKLRKKRATPFVYEPYKIIHDKHIQDSKKTTTSSNISPLIKHLQSSKVVDTVTKITPDKDQPVKRNVTPKVYKDIGRKDRVKSKGEDTSNDSFVDVNVDIRRGEPRYELRPSNHKLQYTPAANKTVVTVDEYKVNTQKNKTMFEDDKNSTKVNDDYVIMNIQRNSRQRLKLATSITTTTQTPIYDISLYLPKVEEFQKIAASNTVRRVIRTTTQAGKLEQNYDFDASTTPKSVLIRRIRSTTTTTSTTSIPQDNDENVTRYPKLRLITRSKSTTSAPIITLIVEATTEKEKQVPESTIKTSNHSDKQKQTTKSIKEDVHSYSNNDSDSVNNKSDALTEDGDSSREYRPKYENEKENISSESNENDYSSEEDDDYYDDESQEDEEEDKDDVKDSEPEQTTSEAIRRTLPLTTESPISTTEKRKEKVEVIPVFVSKKNAALQKEASSLQSPQNITYFKQNVKEIDIVKELPTSKRKKPLKNIEALEIYKDDNLAKDVNKLGEVEVFKENLDLRTGPRHGGNYRMAMLPEASSTTERAVRSRSPKIRKNDAVALQSEINKKVQTEMNPITKRSEDGILEIQSEAPKIRNRARYILRRPEAVKNSETKTNDDANIRGYHINNSNTKRKNAKLTEISSEEVDDDDEEIPLHGGNFKVNRNSRRKEETVGDEDYKNARILKATNSEITANPKNDQQENKKTRRNNAGKNAAIVLNSFAQVVPILTTTPAYIVDPSKRRYYYVDA